MKRLTLTMVLPFRGRPASPTRAYAILWGPMLALELVKLFLAPGLPWLVVLLPVVLVPTLSLAVIGAFFTAIVVRAIRSATPDADGHIAYAIDVDQEINGA